MIAFKYKLYPTDNNTLDHQINIACFIYNHCIALKKRYYKRFKKSISKNTLQKHLTKIKNRSRFGFFSEINSQTIQDITERIEKGYRAFFSKQNKHLPDFKGKKRYHSITFKQTGYKYLGGNEIKIMGKTFRFFLSREIDGKIKTVTVKRDSLGDHYICFVTDGVRKKSGLRTCKECGFDFGLSTFLTTSEGEKIASPEFLKHELKKLKRLSKRLSWKEKYSGRWKRAQRELARLYRKIRNQRLDYMFKKTQELVERYDVLYFEDLCLKGMQKLWGRKVSDVAFGEFMRVLEYRCYQYGKSLVKIDRYVASTPVCNECGWRHPGLTLKDRSWTCSCGAVHDRDINAAKNIIKIGRALSNRLGDVRPILSMKELAVSV